MVPLKEIYLFSNTELIDFEIPIDKKSTAQVRSEIGNLIANGIEVAQLNEKTQAIDSTCPQFPVNGSASRVNRLYEELLLDRSQEFFIPRENQTTELIEERLAERIDKDLSKLDLSTLLEAAKRFDNSSVASHSIQTGPRKVRKENSVQKRRIAAIEDYTCQVCGFHCEYVREDGTKAWIINVDHIFDKADGGSENMRNLWVLCPNCHTKKTCGIIRIDVLAKKITERGLQIKLFKDNHLFV